MSGTMKMMRRIIGGCKRCIDWGFWFGIGFGALLGRGMGLLENVESAGLLSIS